MNINFSPNDGLVVHYFTALARFLCWIRNRFLTKNHHYFSLKLHIFMTPKGGGMTSFLLVKNVENLMHWLKYYKLDASSVQFIYL